MEGKPIDPKKLARYERIAKESLQTLNKYLEESKLGGKLRALRYKWVPPREKTTEDSK
jgi:hypothetical protein